MALGIPKFLQDDKAERSMTQKGLGIVVRTVPRGTYALLKRTLKAIDALITRTTPANYQTATKVAAVATTAVAAGPASSVLSYVTNLLPTATYIGATPTLSLLTGGVATVTAVGTKILLPKAIALLSPEQKAKVDKATLDSLAYLHTIGDNWCGKDKSVYAEQIDLYTAYKDRERYQVVERLDLLTNDRAHRDQFFGPNNNESKIAIQVFNMLSRSHDQEVRNKALAVLAERVIDYGSNATLVDQVKKFHSASTPAFTEIIEGANSLNPKGIHHMFGDRPSSLIFVHNTLLQDPIFLDRLAAATEGVLGSSRTFAGLNEAESTSLRNIHNRNIIDVVSAKNSSSSLVDRIEKLTKGIVDEVRSNRAETDLIPDFNNNLLQNDNFRFSIADFFGDMNSPNPAIQTKAMEKFLTARTILEHQRVQESIKAKPNEQLVKSNAKQQALMLAILHHPSTLGIDDSKLTLEKNIDHFWKTNKGKKLIAMHALQIATVHLAYREHNIGLAINKWNNIRPGDKIPITAMPQHEASHAFHDKQMTYHNELDSATKAFAPELAKFLGELGHPLTFNHTKLAQSLELISQRNPEPFSIDGLLKTVIINDPSIVKNLKSSDETTKTTTIFKLLVSIKNSLLDSKLENGAYSFVAQQLGSRKTMTEADLFSLPTVLRYVTGYSASTDANKLAEHLENISPGTPLATIIASIPNLITDLRDIRLAQDEAVVKLSKAVAADPDSKTIDAVLESDKDIKWDMMRSVYSSGANTSNCNFKYIIEVATNLSHLEKYSQDIDRAIRTGLEPLLEDLFNTTQKTNPNIDVRNTRATAVQSEMMKEGNDHLLDLQRQIEGCITHLTTSASKYEDRVDISYMDLTRDIMNQVFQKAIV